MRALVILAVVALLALPAAARAQDQGDSPFGPLPAAPTPNPQPIVVQQDSNSGDTTRTTLLVIAGGLLITFVVIGRFILRDARRRLPSDARNEQTALREQGPHKHAKHAKARARAKGKAQKAARRRNR